MMSHFLKSANKKKVFNGPYELAPRSSPTMDKLPQLGATDSIVQCLLLCETCQQIRLLFESSQARAVQLTTRRKCLLGLEWRMPPSQPLSLISSKLSHLSSQAIVQGRRNGDMYQGSWAHKAPRKLVPNTHYPTRKLEFLTQPCLLHQSTTFLWDQSLKVW